MVLEWCSEVESWHTLENPSIIFFVGGYSLGTDNETNCLYLFSKGPHHLTKNIAVGWAGFFCNGVASSLRWEQT